MLLALLFRGSFSVCPSSPRPLLPREASRALPFEPPLSGDAAVLWTDRPARPGLLLHFFSGWEGCGDTDCAAGRGLLASGDNVGKSLLQPPHGRPPRALLAVTDTGGVAATEGETGNTTVYSWVF